MSQLILASGYDLAPPESSPAVSPDISVGALGNDSYAYKITFVTKFGETLPGPASTAVTPTSGSLTLSSIPLEVTSNAFMRKIYRSGAGLTTPYRLVATIADNLTTTYTDLTADVDLGDIEPDSNFGTSMEIERGWVVNSHPTIFGADFTLNATGSDQATSAAVLPTSTVTVVTVPAPGNGIRMPPTRPEFIGMKLTIRNSSLNPLRIYTHSNSGNMGAGIGVAYLLAALTTQDFIVDGVESWRSLEYGGGGGGGGVLSGDANGPVSGNTVDYFKGGIPFGGSVGGFNVGVGTNFSGITSGTSNTAVGINAGSNITSGSNLTCIGNGAEPSSASATNEITLGDAAVTVVRSQGVFSTLSDARDKRDIVSLGACSDLLKKLRPVKYVWDMRVLEGQPENIPRKVGIQDVGFIAQELIEAQATAEVHIPSLVHTGNPSRYEISPGQLVPVIIKALQEALAEIDILKSQMRELTGYCDN